MSESMISYSLLSPLLIRLNSFGACSVIVTSSFLLTLSFLIHLSGCSLQKSTASMSYASVSSTSALSFSLASSSELNIRLTNSSSSESCYYFPAIMVWYMPVIPMSNKWMRLRLTTRPIVVYLLRDDYLKLTLISLCRSSSSSISCSLGRCSLSKKFEWREGYFSRPSMSTSIYCYDYMWLWLLMN